MSNRNTKKKRPKNDPYPPKTPVKQINKMNDFGRLVYAKWPN
jgi:hypothetical protein